MKTTQMLASALVASLALASTSLAATESSRAVSQYLEHYKVLRTDVPLPIKIVAPTGLPWNYRAATIHVTMLIDREGRPQNIEIGSRANPEVTQLLVSALVQWRFSPALKDGVPVEQRVTLPIRLS